jgi:hypothetical protein
MLQRGRKSQALRAMIPHVPHPVVDVLPDDPPPPPPELLDAPEQKIWSTIVREHPFNRAGHLMLENALLSLGRARKCREIIERDGAMIMNREGMPMRHPLLAIEVQSRKLVRDTFKALKIELG